MNRRVAVLAVLFLGALGVIALGVSALLRTRQLEPARLPAIASMPAACAFDADSSAAAIASGARKLGFLSGAAKPWTGRPLRVADWALSKQSLLILTGSQESALDTLLLYNPRTGATDNAGQRRSATLLPRWTDGLGRATDQQDLVVDAQILNLPRAAVAQPMVLVTSLIRVLNRPDSTQSIVFGAQRAVLVDTAGGSCTLTINWEGDADLPLIDAAWSSDGRYLAMLMVADPERLGPTTLRILDMAMGKWRTVKTGDGAISAMRWRPASHDVFVALAHLEAPERLDTVAAIDADTLASIALDGAPELFAPGYWGFVFDDAGRVMYAACGVPDDDGVLRSNALCLWTVAP